MSTLYAAWKKLTEDAGLKILSLVLAFLLWLIVVSIDNPMMTLPFSSIPVTVENADLMAAEGKAFELMDSSKSVSVSVRAERSVLSELSRDNFRAVINMSELDGNQVPIEVKATKYADRIQSITPRQKYATVMVENLMESQFAVRVEITGEVAENYAVGTTTLGNNLVRVSGPESVVSVIDHAAVRVDVSGMVNEIHTTEKILLLDSEGMPVDTSTLTLSISESSVTVAMWKVKDITVVCEPSGTPAAGYASSGPVELSPSVVSVTGADRALSRISSVTIPEAALSLEGAVDTVSATVDISDYLPEGIYLVNESAQKEVTVTAPVEILESRNLSIAASRLSVINVPEGMRAAVETMPETVTVTVQGLKADLDSLNPEELTGTVDLQAAEPDENGQFTPGIYTASVTLLLPEGVTQSAASIELLLQVDAGAGEDSAEEEGETGSLEAGSPETGTPETGETGTVDPEGADASGTPDSVPAETGP